MSENLSLFVFRKTLCVHIFVKGLHVSETAVHFTDAETFCKVAKPGAFWAVTLSSAAEEHDGLAEKW